MLSRWPSVWDDDELAPFSSSNNNLDVYETADEVVVRANVAGVPADKVEMTFEKGVLWIKAEKEETSQDSEKKHYSKSSWSYSYRVAVPGMIDYTAEPQAEIEDGVAIITFKKAEASKPKKLTIKKK
ncbi:MAG: Hsp20/alpha crystallin family protein [Candidatus Pacebacteria bacterium]|nr:Hsp20/alpha crystallin family protein [Candidatus Paceibacterota bacterium]